MIKTHNTTKLKYLCKTERNDPYRYKGSGTYWKKHIEKYGCDIETVVIYETENKQELKNQGMYYSSLWNIVKSKEWANCIPEEGDGGNTVSNKFWITNGIQDKFNNKGEDIPTGWCKGRSTGGFTNKVIQKELSSRVDRKKLGESVKKAWKEGRFIRDHSKCGIKGDLNPSKRSDVKAKKMLKACRPGIVRGISFRSVKEAALYFKVSSSTIIKWRKNE